MFKSLFAGLLAAFLLAAGPQACAQAAEPALHIARGAAPPGASTLALPPPPRASVIENGRQCTVITFEGVGDLAPIPVFDGISSPGWLGIIDADAGGTGNFAQEPSPQTIAFWLGGDPGSRDIVMANKASKVEFYYASYVGVTMQALDEAGNVLATATGGPNYRGGSGDPNGDFNRWDPLSVEADGNKIKTVRVTGNTNQTGIDNLKVCSTIGVEAVEMTQAIQQYQDLAALKASLGAAREPPVPVVAGKTGVLRVYMQKVDAVTTVSLRLTGQVNQNRTVTLQPQCQPEDQRRERNGCRAVNFYFIPPEGDWDVNIKVVDSGGNVLEDHDLPFKSRKTDTLTMKAVQVCDARNAAGTWLCAPASALAGNTTLLRKIAPTASVGLDITNSVVRRDASLYAAPFDWWVAAAKDTNDLYGFFDWLAALGGEHRTYYGMVRTAAPGGFGGVAHDIPSHAAIGRTSATRLGVETVQEVVAHETGHTLGLRHTNTGAPAAGAAPPGCYNTAADSGTDWPFADNRIQSAARTEVGFDVGNARPLAPETTFDIMSYCVPRWISPLRYKRAMTALGGGAVAGPSVVAGDQDAALAGPVPAPLPRAVVDGVFWTVSGTLEQGGVRFDALFGNARRGPNDRGEGTHRIELRSSGGAVLFTRAFTPAVAHTESAGGDASGPPTFFELIPFNASAAAIAVLDPSGATLGVLALGGAPPVVDVLRPLAGGVSGVQEIAWQVADPDSGHFTSKVYYTADSGATWAQIGKEDGALALKADFDTLPGGSGSVRIKVVVSDGVNTGTAVTPPLSVPKKVPQNVAIVQPADGAAFAPQAMVELEGIAYDVDDGMLDGTAVSWTSSLDGPLGTGAALGVGTLRTGTHMITMRATDSDGNTASAAATVHVAGAPPQLELLIAPLDTLPTTCVEASIAARAEPGSVALAKAEYSVDGGATWTGVPLDRLPLKFRVPGSGFFHMIARVFDAAGQVTARDAKFFVDSSCAASGPPRIDGALAGKGVAAPGVIYVDLKLTNNGQGAAQQVRVDTLGMLVLSGSGTPSFNAMSPHLPIALPDLAPGGSATVRLYINLPSTVKRFSLIDSGTLRDSFGRTLKFSTTQMVLP
ncbi:hypothetical protein ASC94_07690 [Massilia sp. Root418]|jgi:hypothetical protein|uniref:hypothetical protein n=1 Tax=Massilia sp. Root418 TaxID=1736532 RepID=UPI0006F2442B|nr:hypothetical protein [Massilia sp. Root418]KQW96704.1 hypothetical protein ASC94_07690 [Massilia sp. Root418]